MHCSLGKFISANKRRGSVANGNMVALSKIFQDRPSPLDKYDQVHMTLDSMLVHVQVIAHYLKDKACVFMGDAEGVALCLLYLSKVQGMPAPDRCIVFDFDERVLRWMSATARTLKVSDRLEVVLYNVVDPLPPSRIAVGNRFHTNPPYGSANCGFSPSLFLHRALEATTPKASGCIILPSNAQKDWMREVMFNFQKACIEYGCFILEAVSSVHQYEGGHDKDLKSGILFIERKFPAMLPYVRKRVPAKALHGFYGHAEVNMPRYIRTKEHSTNFWEDHTW